MPSIQFKRGTAKKWEEANPILLAGQPGFVTDKNKFKIGDGKTHWNDLNYIGEDNVVNRPTHYDFPSIGNDNTIYKAETEKKLYQWNTELLKYELLSDSEDTLDIEIINGGNANGTT